MFQQLRNKTFGHFWIPRHLCWIFWLFWNIILFQEVRNVKNVDAGDPEFETILSLVVHLYPPSHWNSIKAPTGGGEWEFLWNIPLEFYCSVNVNLILSSGKTWIIFLSSQFTSISASAYKSASSKYALEVDLIGIHNWLHFECWQWFYFIFPLNHHRVAIFQNAFESLLNVVVYFTVF